MAYTLAHTGQSTITFNTGTFTTGYNVDLEGVNLGENQTTWDEVPSYAGGANAQVNVKRWALIPVTIPLTVYGSSVSDLETKLHNLWHVVDACTFADPGTLTWDATGNFDIVYSTRPDVINRDPMFQLKFMARFTLVLTRKPAALT